MLANINSILKHRGLLMTEGYPELEECISSDILDMWKTSDSEEYALDQGISKLAVLSLWLDLSFSINATQGRGIPNCNE